MHREVSPSIQRYLPQRFLSYGAGRSALRLIKLWLPQEHKETRMHALARESNGLEYVFRGSFQKMIQAVAEAFKNVGSCPFAIFPVENKVASKTNEIRGMVQLPWCSLVH